MRALTVSELRSNLGREIDQVIEDKDELIISRSSGSAVVVDLDEYNALKETSYLLRSPANARAVFESLAQIESGGGTERAYR